MIFTRRIGKILRGRATPFQVICASTLGSLIAFVPGFSQGPGLLLTYILLLLVLNANLGVALLVALPARLLAMLLLPLSFTVGRGLIDGPTSGLFETLINAPVFAWFGFDVYATTGGIVVGAVVGFGFGVLIALALRSFRRKMASLDENSERFREWSSKFGVKVMLFLFVGGRRGKKSYAELAESKVGFPIRIVGVVVAVAVVVGVFLLQGLLTGPLATQLAQSELESANGATVDLGKLSLDLGEGRLTIADLAMADAADLARDILRADRIEADVSSSDLLRKRLTIDRLVVQRATTGEVRESPGRHVGEPPKPRTEPKEGDVKTIEDYLEDVEVWKERLAQAREWIEKMGEGAEEDEEARETDDERVEREVRDLGYKHVRATHRVKQSPTLLVRELAIEQLIAPWMEGDELDVRARNLSTQPALVDGAPALEVRSKSERLRLDLALDALSSDPKENRVAFFFTGPTDKLASGLRVGGERPLSGGTIAIDLDGQWSRRLGVVDLPLDVRLENTTLRVPGGSSQEVSQFALPIQLSGPIDDLTVKVAEKELNRALVEAGADQLKQELRSEVDDALDEGKKKLSEELKERGLGDIGEQVGEGAGGVLEGLLGGKKKKKDD